MKAYTHDLTIGVSSLVENKIYIWPLTFQKILSYLELSKLIE